MKLAHVQREEVDEVEQWSGYTTSRKTVYFSGLTLGLIAFSNEPQRYMVRFAEITRPKWSHIAPFRVGESISSARRKLAPRADGDLNLEASYGSEAGNINFAHARGKITKVTYSCYTG